MLKNMIGSNIFTVSDSESSKMLAKFLVNKNIFFYKIRKITGKKIYNNRDLSLTDINNGFKFFKSKIKSNLKKNLIISNGYQIHRIFELLKKRK